MLDEVKQVIIVYIWLNDDDISDVSLIEILNSINRLDLRDDMIYNLLNLSIHH